MSTPTQRARLPRWVAGPLIAALMLIALLGAGKLSSAAGPARMNAILLVARPNLHDDPTFTHAVVLVMNNLGPAPQGLIVNRPTPLPVAKLFPSVKALAKVPDRVYFGGPVNLDEVWFLIRASTPPQHAIQTCPGLYFSTSPALLKSLLSRRNPMENLRIFIGHAGWDPEQLRDEINDGAWKLERAQSATIFSTPEHAWPEESEPKNAI